MEKANAIRSRVGAHPLPSPHKPVSNPGKTPTPKKQDSVSAHQRAAQSKKELKDLRGGKAPASRLREHQTATPQFRPADGKGWRALPPRELHGAPKRAEGAPTRAAGGPVRQPKEMIINGHVYIKNGQVVR